ncbi:MAG: hypothetical protein KYX68_02760 [Flavobacterium sp.]|nr:hypothetical protein [Flavobacterium sp.]
MKKNNLYLVLTLTFLSFILFNCSNENLVSKEQNAKTTFIDVTSTSQNSSSAKKGWWVIADWDWGRESRQCKSGFGVCHWDWFPGWKLATTPLKDGKVRTPILFDDQLNIHYVEFLLEEGSAKEEFLTIDNDLSMDVTIDNETERITFGAGQYSFDASLGQNGGYRVNAK